MKNFINRYSVRSRIILSALFSSVVLFLFITPVIGWIIDYALPPVNVYGVEITQVVVNANKDKYSENIEIRWQNPSTVNRSKINIKTSEINTISVSDKIDQVNFETKEFPVNLVISTKGIFGRSSSEIKVTVEKLTEGQSINTTIVSEGDESTNDQSEGARGVRISIALAILIFLTSLFVINFNVSNFKKLALSFYPAISSLPILFIITSVVENSDSGISKFSLSLLISFLFFVYIYFLTLTANILHTSLEVSIPLGQAARASELIFSLVSSYTVLIIFFGAGYSFFEKVLFISLFLTYYSFTSVMMLEGSNLRLITEKTLGIIGTIVFAIFVLSIWPISYIYAILAIAVIYYILLSISLEVRSKLSEYVMIEYSLLITLITAILLVNANWGILGALI